ncbi:MAG: hypothetical protein HYT40_02915 [Candidatus Sungbacteria bacterium]|uniref:Uncharacterized protein n=1 Tax=Candidatus Sungiibacteriota bacterium TaxID=2750080 RepID=A0A931WNW6_9BACT|nr:hypothetical protein [Candidatus Sungbacteria bacterium]
MDVRIVKNKISQEELEDIAKNQFGSMVKAVVDTEKEIMAIGGELHADEEAALLENGSAQKNLWGINLYLDKSDEDWIEFDSMINIRPSQANKSRTVENPEIREKIMMIVLKLTR